MRFLLIAVSFLSFVGPIHAGLHYSMESQAELPSRWRGFLLDLRALRMIGANTPSPSLLREQYLEAASKLQTTSKQRDLNAEEIADLGALYCRLNEPAKALQVLRPALRNHPSHFRIYSNCGTASQMLSDYEAAAVELTEAVSLAPAMWKKPEELQLKLVRGRLRDQRQKLRDPGLDDLFGVRYADDAGKPQAGKITDSERKKIPADDAVLVQQLLLWLPSDGRLLWQLGEIANAHGDVRTAANMLDGCVIEFRMFAADLRERRTLYRGAAEAIEKLPESEHDKYRGDLKFKSQRPLLKKIDAAMLPAIRPDGVNLLSWLVLEETTLARPFKPRFAKHLENLDGKRIAMTGFMQPLGPDVNEVGSFLFIEFPIGCWFCEAPETAGIIFIALPEGKSVLIRKGLIKVEGVLSLNRNDPEQYLYSLNEARVSEPD